MNKSAGIRNKILPQHSEPPVLVELVSTLTGALPAPLTELTG